MLPEQVLNTGKYTYCSVRVMSQTKFKVNKPPPGGGNARLFTFLKANKEMFEQILTIPFNTLLLYTYTPINIYGHLMQKTNPVI
jgi:hypothetical protein